MLEIFAVKNGYIVRKTQNGRGDQYAVYNLDQWVAPDSDALASLVKKLGEDLIAEAQPAAKCNCGQKK